MELKHKEEAKRLVELFSNQTYDYQPYAGAHYHTSPIGDEADKKCALACIDEIIKALDHHQWQNREIVKYYQEVKKEIKLL